MSTNNGKSRGGRTGPKPPAKVAAPKLAPNPPAPKAVQMPKPPAAKAAQASGSNAPKAPAPKANAAKAAHPPKPAAKHAPAPKPPGVAPAPKPPGVGGGQAKSITEGAAELGSFAAEVARQASQPAGRTQRKPLPPKPTPPKARAEAAAGTASGPGSAVKDDREASPVPGSGSAADGPQRGRAGGRPAPPPPTPAKPMSAKAARRAAAQAAGRKDPAKKGSGKGQTVKPTWVITAVLALALLLILVLGRKHASPVPGGTAAYGVSQTATVVTETTNVPIGLADGIGKGTADPLPAPLKGAALTSGGKPEMLYMGGEFCPYCATERWAMVIALSRFGTFDGLALTHSSSTDAYPNTPSFTFAHASFSSPYLVFTPVEMATNQPGKGLAGYGRLKAPTATQQRLWEKLEPSGGIPFIDIGGRFWVDGATYEPGVLQGKTPVQVADSLANPASPITKGAVGAANTIVAAICRVTSQQPSDVCNTPAIKSIQASMG